MLSGSKAELSISYEKPKGFFNKILSFLFANWYCKWCLKQMLEDTKTSLEVTTNNPKHFKTKNL